MDANATVHERGNGLPEVGDYVPGSGGNLCRIEAFVGPIHTGRPGSGNYIHALVTEADWDDIADGEEFPAKVRLMVAE